MEEDDYLMVLHVEDEKVGSFGVESSSRSIWRVDGRLAFQAKRSSVTWKVILCRSWGEISEQPYKMWPTGDTISHKTTNCRLISSVGFCRPSSSVLDVV